MSALTKGTKVARHSGAAHRRAHLWFELMLALVVLVVFVPVKHWFEHTHFGHWLEMQTHVWLQSHLHAPTSEHFPIVVVDIADLKPTAYEVTLNDEVRQEFFTPREPLRRAIGVVATAGAAGIGVDVDLSLEPELKVGPALGEETHRLFNDALARRTNCAIYFGVKRNEGLPPETWLGGQAYIPLAASLARPKGLVREMPSIFGFPGHDTPLRSLAQALAEDRLAEDRPWLNHFAKKVSEIKPVKNAPDFRLSQHLVDYAPLELLISSRVSVSTVLAAITNGPAAYAKLGALFSGRLVLLGDATPFGGGDTANVPGRAEPVPGVYVHACATYTLSREPLYRLNLIPGMILATLGSFLAVTLVYAVCFRYARRHNVTTIPLTVLMTFALLGLFIVLAILLARFAHIFWLEVVAVCVVLVVHCFVEILLGTIKWERFPEGVVKSLVVASSPGKEQK